jgi:hypothetical protein
MAAIDDQSALREEPGTGARPGTPLQLLGIARYVEVEAFEAAQSRGYGEGQLRAGAEAGMGRNGFTQDKLILAGQAEMLPYRFEMRSGANMFRPGNALRSRRRECQRGRRRIQGKAYAAKTPPDASIEIEKP